MLKLKEGYTVYKRTPIYGYYGDVADTEFDTIKSRLSKDEAIKMVEQLNSNNISSHFCYGYAPDLEYHGYSDPARWIDDGEDYNALVAAGEIHRETE